MTDLLGAHSELEDRLSSRTAELLELNQHLEREVAERRRRADELAVLNTLSGLMSASLSLEQVIDACLDGIMDCMALDLAVIYLCEGDLLVPQGVRVRDPELAHYAHRTHCIGQCLCGLAAAEKRPLYSSDIRDDPQCSLDECKNAGLRSVAALPLVAGEWVLGVVTIASTSGQDYAQRSTFWEALRGQVAIAVHNAYLHRRLQQHVDDLKQEVSEHAQTAEYLQSLNQALALFGRTVHALSSELDTERVLDSIIEQVRRLLGVVACSVWVLEPQANELVCQQAAGFGNATVLGWRLPIGVGIVGKAARTAKTVNVPDTRREKNHYKAIDHQTGVETRSVLAVPLQAQGKTIGVLEVVDDAPNRFSSTDVTLVEWITLSAANALENARVHEALQASQRVLERRNRDLLVLNAISTIIGQSLNPDQTLALCLDKILEMTSADAGWIGLFGPGRESLSKVISRGFGAEMLGKLEAAGVHSTAYKTAIAAGEPIVLPVFLTESDLGRGDSDRPVATKLVGVPIRARERLLGVLGALFYSNPDIDDQDVQLLTTIGHQLGSAVEHIRLLEEASEIEALRSLDTMRSELIATASHELRTPLGLIRLFATALLMEEVALDVETSQQFLSGIADETEKLEHILDDLLNLSRMESGRLLLDRRSVDLVQLVEDTLDRMSIELEGYPQKIDMDERHLMAVVDPARIEQVLRNLLSNAVKYSAPGSAITVRGWQAGESITIAVIDRGIGIPAEEQGRIFERFYRVDNDLTRRTRGAGLGLPICKWIVEAHGGSIQVFSKPGDGSEFRTTLPRDIGV